jgi:hypothetical protein
MSKEAIRSISRSGHETHTECPRKYYYNYAYKGTGFNSAKPAVDLIMGLAVHAGLEALLKGASPEESNSAALTEYDNLVGRWMGGEDPLLITQLKSHRELVEGLVRGWIRAKWGQFQEQYTIVSVERETQTPLAPNVVLLARCDAVLRSNYDGMLYVLNWKTSSSNALDWGALWQYEIQMWTEALAVEQDMEEEVIGCVVVGLKKGYRKDGIFQSLLTRGWTREMPHGREFSPTRPRKGSTKEPSWEKFATSLGVYPTGEKGISGWINWLPLSTLDGLFPVSPPILKNNKVVEDWLKQVVRRESDAQYMLEEGSEEDRLNFFYQRWTPKCKWCPFNNVCTQTTTIDEMIKDGFLEERVDHHAPQEAG